MTKVKPVDPRRKARMASLQCLFAVDLRPGSQENHLAWLVEDNPLPIGAMSFAQDLVEGVRDSLTELDELIFRYAPAWPVSQLPVVDRNVIRIALFELLYRQETPRKSAVNEAVELAKLFGSESSARFVNGVLGSVMADLESGTLMVEQPVREGR